MKTIKSYIKEGLKITSKTKVSRDIDLPKDVIENLEDILCDYFQDTDYYDGSRYKTRLDILDDYYNGNIYDLIYDKQIMGYYEDFIKELENKFKSSIDVNQLFKIKSYIKNHNEELYKIITDFVLR